MAYYSLPKIKAPAPPVPTRVENSRANRGVELQQRQGQLDLQRQLLRESALPISAFLPQQPQMAPAMPMAQPGRLPGFAEGGEVNAGFSRWNLGGGGQDEETEEEKYARMLASEAAGQAAAQKQARIADLQYRISDLQAQKPLIESQVTPQGQWTGVIPNEAFNFDSTWTASQAMQPNRSPLAMPVPEDRPLRSANTLREQLDPNNRPGYGEVLQKAPAVAANVGINSLLSGLEGVGNAAEQLGGAPASSLLGGLPGGGLAAAGLQRAYPDQPSITELGYEKTPWAEQARAGNEWLGQAGDTLGGLQDRVPQPVRDSLAPGLGLVNRLGVSSQDIGREVGSHLLPETWGQTAITALGAVGAKGPIEAATGLPGFDDALRAGARNLGSRVATPEARAALRAGVGEAIRGGEAGAARIPAGGAAKDEGEQLAQRFQAEYGLNQNRARALATQVTQGMRPMDEVARDIEALSPGTRASVDQQAQAAMRLDFTKDQLENTMTMGEWRAAFAQRLEEARTRPALQPGPNVPPAAAGDLGPTIPGRPAAPQANFDRAPYPMQRPAPGEMVEGAWGGTRDRTLDDVTRELQQGYSDQPPPLQLAPGSVAGEGFTMRPTSPLEAADLARRGVPGDRQLGPQLPNIDQSPDITGQMTTERLGSYPVSPSGVPTETDGQRISRLIQEAQAGTPQQQFPFGSGPAPTATNYAAFVRALTRGASLTGNEVTGAGGRWVNDPAKGWQPADAEAREAFGKWNGQTAPPPGPTGGVPTGGTPPGWTAPDPGNLPLNDPEKYQASQLWMANAPANPPVSKLTTAQIQDRLYNAGLEAVEPTGLNRSTGNPRMTPEDNRRVRDRYEYANSRGIKMPAEEAPSGMPDAYDLARAGRTPQSTGNPQDDAIRNMARERNWQNAADMEADQEQLGKVAQAEVKRLEREGGAGGTGDPGAARPGGGRGRPGRSDWKSESSIYNKMFDLLYIPLSGDIGTALRQDVMRTLNPFAQAETRRVMGNTARAIGSLEGAEEVMAELNALPGISSLKIKMQYADVAGMDLTNKETQVSDLLTRAPLGVGKFFGGTQRGNAVWVNSRRAYMVESFIARHAANPNVTKAHVQTYANGVAALTGRGDVGDLTALGPLFTSLRFMASMPQRAAYLLPVTRLADTHKLELFGPVWREMVKEHAGFFASVAGIMAIADGAGARVGWDPNRQKTGARGEPAFGQIKVGNTTLDITGGVGGYMRSINSLVTGKVNDENYPRILRMHEDMRYGQRYQGTVAEFLRNKGGPLPGIMASLAKFGLGQADSNALQKELAFLRPEIWDRSPLGLANNNVPLGNIIERIISHVSPIYLMEVVEAVQKNGGLTPEGLAHGVGAALFGGLGGGVQAYERMAYTTKSAVLNETMEKDRPGTFGPLLNSKIGKNENYGDLGSLEKQLVLAKHNPEELRKLQQEAVQQGDKYQMGLLEKEHIRREYDDEFTGLYKRMVTGELGPHDTKKMAKDIETRMYKEMNAVKMPEVEFGPKSPVQKLESGYRNIKVQDLPLKPDGKPNYDLQREIQLKYLAAVGKQHGDDMMARVALNVQPRVTPADHALQKFYDTPEMRKATAAYFDIEKKYDQNTAEGKKQANAEQNGFLIENPQRNAMLYAGGNVPALTTPAAVEAYKKYSVGEPAIQFFVGFPVGAKDVSYNTLERQHPAMARLIDQYQAMSAANDNKRYDLLRANPELNALLWQTRHISTIHSLGAWDKVKPR